MTDRVARPPASVWLLLIALTLLSVGLAERGHLGRIGIVAMFAIAAAKGEVMISSFMEVARALPHWRVAYRVWLAVVAIVLAFGHLAG